MRIEKEDIRKPGKYQGLTNFVLWVMLMALATPVLAISAGVSYRVFMWLSGYGW